MIDNSRKPIYTHTHLDLGVVEKLKPLFESSFGNQIGLGQESDNPMRKKIQDERWYCFLQCPALHNVFVFLIRAFYFLYTHHHNL